MAASHAKKKGACVLPPFNSWTTGHHYLRGHPQDGRLHRFRSPNGHVRRSGPEEDDFTHFRRRISGGLIDAAHVPTRGLPSPDPLVPRLIEAARCGDACMLSPSVGGRQSPQIPHSFFLLPGHCGVSEGGSPPLTGCHSRRPSVVAREKIGLVEADKFVILDFCCVQPNTATLVV
jgi:hypothetical protein